MEKQAFFCSCGSNEHLFVLTKFNDDPEFTYLSVHLADLGLFSRIRRGLAYIMGYKCKDGEFSEICLDEETRSSIIKFLSP